jgi:hypothetical protein
MRARIKITFTLILLLPLAAVSVCPAVAQTPAQTAAATEKPSRAELALGYAYLHSNAPPGSCGCFNLNGGSATFAWPLKQGSFALVGDIVSVYANGVSANGYSIILSAFSAGVRYSPPMRHSSLHPFGQLLLGAAHSSGTLVQGSNPGAANASAAFAANVGGGLDLRTSQRISIRLIEAGYLVTTFDNGTNNHQNNLRIGAGVVVRFGK